MLIKGGVALITRGFGQTVSLEPYLYAEDPDYPEKQYDGMEFRWFCRQLTEEYPTTENGSLLYEGSKNLFQLFFSYIFY